MGCFNSKPQGQAIHPQAAPAPAKADPNSRCILMINGVTAVNAKLEKAEKELRELAAATERAVLSGQEMMEQEVPTVYEGSLPAGAVGGKSGEIVAGVGYLPAANAVALARLASELQAQVYRPIDDYEAKVEHSVNRQRAVNAAWAKQEAKRASVAKQRADVAALRAHAGGAKIDILEAEAKALASAEAELQGLTAAHTGEEEAQYERLKALISETPALRACLAAALEHVAVALLAAKATIPPCIDTGTPTGDVSPGSQVVKLTPLVLGSSPAAGHRASTPMTIRQLA